jgi:hypothetical protein
MSTACSASCMSHCSSCHTGSMFNGEIGIHFRGREGLDKPVVFLFPEIAVCLDCGFAEFMVPGTELQVLTHGVPLKGAAVLLQQKQRPEPNGG